MTREEFIDAFDIKDNEPVTSELDVAYLIADALEIAGLAPWLAKPEPAPVPPITRERLAEELRETWTNSASLPWITAADRAIELLGASSKHHDEHHAKEQRWMERHKAVIRERDEARDQVKQAAAIAELDAEDYRETIRERDEARAEVERLQERLADCDEEDSAALLQLRQLIDKHIGWRNFEQEEAGDYAARIVEVGTQLATTLPPIPPGDEGPKALKYAWGGASTWEQLSAPTQESFRAQWAAAVRLLRGAP